MKINNILVVGGTGMLGFPVAKELTHHDYSVSILTTNKAAAGAKIGRNHHFIEGNVKDPKRIKEILISNEFEGIHINLASLTYKELEEVELNGTLNVLEAAKENNIKKLTMISGLGVQPKNAWSPFIKAKLKMEKALVSSGIPYTIFNCTHFMESIPKYIRNGKISVIGTQPHSVHWVAASDYAEMVAKAFSNTESNDKIISVLGPEAMTMKEAFHKYIEIVDPKLKYAEAPLGAMKIISTVTFNKTLRYVSDLMAYFEKVPEQPAKGTLTHVLGTPKTTLDQWLNKQK